MGASNWLTAPQDTGCLQKIKPLQQRPLTWRNVDAMQKLSDITDPTNNDKAPHA
jgi:hypothetical protein